MADARVVDECLFDQRPRAPTMAAPGISELKQSRTRKPINFLSPRFVRDILTDKAHRTSIPCLHSHRLARQTRKSLVWFRFSGQSSMEHQTGGPAFAGTFRLLKLHFPLQLHSAISNAGEAAG
jgi:hypothetical protein